MVEIAGKANGGAAAKTRSSGNLGGVLMKLVVAVIAPDKIDLVRQALPEPDAYIYYVNQVGDIREPIQGHYRGQTYLEPRARLRVEIIVVNEMLLDEVVDTVIKAAATNMEGHVSSGNIFVLPLDAWHRIPNRKTDSPGFAEPAEKTSVFK
jgi:nitrogen regulatory protein PII